MTTTATPEHIETWLGQVQRVTRAMERRTTGLKQFADDIAWTNPKGLNPDDTARLLAQLPNLDEAAAVLHLVEIAAAREYLEQWEQWVDGENTRANRSFRDEADAEYTRAVIDAVRADCAAAGL